MSFSATASYIWLQQAFLAMFATWMMEDEIFDAIISGNIVYELCRPVRIYRMWFARSIANRLSRAMLRCVPILAVAVFLPEPYGLTAPADAQHFLLFLVTLLFGLSVTVSFCMLIYVLTFFTVSPQGLRMVFVSAVEFLAGGIIPLPFLPSGVQRVVELLPFASMQNVPFRIYSGSMSDEQMLRAILLQVFWFVTIMGIGSLLCTKAERKIVLQGG